MNTQPALIIDTLTDTALRYLHQGRMAQGDGDELTAHDCFADAASLIEEAGYLAGAHGLDMPAALDGEHGLVDLFQSVASEAFEAAAGSAMH